MKDLTGKRFGRLVVEEFVRTNAHGTTYWLCRCECGNTKIVSRSNLISKNVMSCGCLAKENKTKHGKRHTRIYGIWLKMKDRCNNVRNKRYSSYGGRNIKLCDEWNNNFIKFYEWSMSNGYKENLSIDRIDNNGNYEPNNCRWTTNKVQCNNKSTNHYIEYNGEKHTISEWNSIMGYSRSLIQRRLKLGWSIKRIFETPVRGKNGI